MTHNRYFEVKEEDGVVELILKPCDFRQKYFVGTEEEALEFSIQKWEFLLEQYKKRKYSYIYNGGASTCALCSLYMNRKSKGIDCKKCQVYKKTGDEGCMYTPYEDYKQFGRAVCEWKAKVECCKKEIEFLQSLRK